MVVDGFSKGTRVVLLLVTVCLGLKGVVVGVVCGCGWWSGESWVMRYPWLCKVLRFQYAKLLVIRRLYDFRYFLLLLLLLLLRVQVVAVVVLRLRRYKIHVTPMLSSPSQTF